MQRFYVISRKARLGEELIQVGKRVTDIEEQIIKCDEEQKRLTEAMKQETRKKRNLNKRLMTQ